MQKQCWPLHRESPTGYGARIAVCWGPARIEGLGFEPQDLKRDVERKMQTLAARTDRAATRTRVELFKDSLNGTWLAADPLLPEPFLTLHCVWSFLRRRCAGASCSYAKSFQEVVQLIRQRMKKDVFTPSLLSTCCRCLLRQLEPFYTSNCIAACRTKPMKVTKSSRGTKKSSGRALAMGLCHTFLFVESYKLTALFAVFHSRSVESG